ncbi:sugar ABC transporter permease [Paenibacillus psychroresistens]|uniref:Sugar ABC transporter permease n=1 Tax=Paenibacillus psychroresistens TaxID=1778678 RepID=A0A6B8RCW7_9BACL|nr:sugar ABC transporter permease [Paenibacillus psychroresistens]QGQ94099.1 sugar ABC transporter permease [Paenibacillus psychroresistens]
MRGLLFQFRNSLPAYLLLSPLFVGLLLFAYYPPVSSFIHAFSDWNIYGETKWIGLHNFKMLFQDPIFVHSIPTLFYLLIPSLFVAIVPPFIVAEMIFSVRRVGISYWYRVLVLIPMVVPGTVVLLIWQYIYDPQSGLLNTLLHTFGFPEDYKPGWLGDSQYALFSLNFLGFPWIGGTSVLIYLAGLMNISKEVIESAELEGASFLQRVWHIDIPSIMGQVKFFLILGIISGMQDYSKQLVLTQGGPNYSTMVPGYYMYSVGFSFGRMGEACAIGVMLFVVIFFFSLLGIKYLKMND